MFYYVYYDDGVNERNIYKSCKTVAFINKYILYLRHL